MKKEDLKLKLDLKKEYGLVLEGGGARGAYQIGAWKALKEAGISIKGIAGTSVGALNGALIAMDDLALGEAIWESIRYSDVMDVDDAQMEQLRRAPLKHIPQLIRGGTKILKDKGIDISPLRRLIGRIADEERIRASACSLYAVTYSLTDHKPMVMDLKEVPQGQIADMLMASAYLLGFRKEPLGGKYYRDGCRVSNVPVDVLIDQGYQDILVIRIYGFGVDTEKKLKVPPDVNLYHIFPRQDLGGILEFETKRARKNMMLGYYDALRLLYGLEGRLYYIYAPQGEAWCYHKLSADIQWLSGFLESGWDEGQREPSSWLRRCNERLFPAAASACGLGPDWTYKQLYISLLETGAKRCGISRFHLYSLRELRSRMLSKKRA